MSSPTGILRYAGTWNVSTEYRYGMLVVASNSLSYALGVPTNTGTDPTSIAGGGIWFPVPNNILTPGSNTATNIAVGVDATNLASIVFIPAKPSAYVTATVNYTPTSAAGTTMTITLATQVQAGGAFVIDVCTVVSTGAGNTSSVTLGGIMQIPTVGQLVQLLTFASTPAPGIFTVNRANLYFLYNITDSV